MDILEVVLKRSEVNFRVLVQHGGEPNGAYGHHTLCRAVDLAILGVEYDGVSWDLPSLPESEMMAELITFTEPALEALRRLRTHGVREHGLAIMTHEELLASREALPTIYTQWRLVLAKALTRYLLITRPELQEQYPDFTPVGVSV